MVIHSCIEALPEIKSKIAFEVTMQLFLGRIHFFLRLYHEIVARFTPPLDDRDLRPIPCQFCGGSHSEKYCPKAKEMGF